jgi:hypothetical protein
VATLAVGGAWVYPAVTIADKTGVQHVKKRLVLVVLSLGALLLAGFAPATADIGFTQQVVLVKDRGPFTMKYSSFSDGTGSCEDCIRPHKIGGGTMKVHLRAYRLVERAKRDYYIVDVTVRTKKRYGSEHYAYIDAKVQNTKASAEKVSQATYSLGKTDVKEDCDTYDINIGASFHGISAGTKVATLDTCTESPITRRGVTRGQDYHVTNFNGVRSVTFQRFVRVSKGAKPVFRVAVSRPTDHCKVYTWADGQHYYCYNQEKTKVWTVGTKR